MQSGNEIIETQTYYTEPENDWVFDETQKMTYDNPVFIEQKKRKHENIDDSGFVIPKKLDELDEEDLDDLDDDIENEIENKVNNEEINSSDWDDDWDSDWDDDEEEIVNKPISFKSEPPKEVQQDNKEDLMNFMNEFEKKEESKKDELMDYINEFDTNNKVEDSYIDTPIENNPFSNNNLPNTSSSNETQSESQPVKKVIKFKL